MCTKVKASIPATHQKVGAYHSPELHKKEFNCPICGVYAHQTWHCLFAAQVKCEDGSPFYPDGRIFWDEFDDVSTIRISGGVTEELERSSDDKLSYEIASDLQLSLCQRCEHATIWFGTETVYPSQGGFWPEPNADIPSPIAGVYNEARQIANMSPKAACALLRLCAEMLCDHLGAGSGTLNTKIAKLEKQDGFPQKLQQMLDVVRIRGNEAVHAGVIDDSDTSEHTLTMMNCINLIADRFISQDKEVDRAYSSLPTSAKAQIKERQDHTGKASQKNTS